MSCDAARGFGTSESIKVTVQSGNFFRRASAVAAPKFPAPTMIYDRFPDPSSFDERIEAILREAMLENPRSSLVLDGVRVRSMVEG